MTPDQPFHLELTIEVTQGLLGQLGSLTSHGRFCMQHAPGTSLGGAVVAFVCREERTDAFREYRQEVDSERALELASQVEALGMPDRVPDVSAVFDTSGSWTNLVLRVKRDARCSELSLSLQCSGFEGADQHQLRRLLQSLCDACGHHAFDRSAMGLLAEYTAPAAVAAGDAAKASDENFLTPRACCFCGHAVAGDYPVDGGITCDDASCGAPLPPTHATCVQVACGHFAPFGAKFCWMCGAPV